MGSSSCRSPILRAFAALLSFCVPLAAQAPFMVKDIATAPHNSVPAWPFYPGPMAEMDGVYYFRASDGVHGVELFRTDLTPAGTWMVKDICAGRCDGAPLLPRPMVAHQGYLYFTADDAIHGVELWRTDGSAAGTSLVADIAPGMNNSYPITLTSLGSLLLFSANAGNGYRLWRSDGTAAGTELVKPGWTTSYLFVEGVLGSSAVVVAETQAEGRELWKTDGTDVGTELILDVAPGTTSGVQSFSNFNGNAPEHLYFQGSAFFFSGATDGASFALWKSDGTAAGTVQVDTTAPIPSDPEWFAQLGGLVYFAATEPGTGRELWRTDGTEAGTGIVLDAELGTGWSDPHHLISNGTAVFYSAFSIAAGVEPWKSDGTPGGTQLVKDTAPGANGLPFNSLFLSAISQNKLFFPADDGVHGLELWVSDGTEAGTTMIEDVFPGSDSGFAASASNGRPLAVPGGVLWFALDPATGFEPWQTDGSAPGTTLVEDIDQQTSALERYFPLAAGGQPGRIFFTANDGSHGAEPWTSDGSGVGTQLLADTKPYPLPYLSYITSFAAAGDRMVFPVAGDNVGFAHSEIWSSDGSPGGTASIFELPDDLYPWSFLSAEGLAYFEAEDGSGSGPLYRTDGTSGGSFVLSEDVDRLLASARERVFFSRSQASPTGELWLTDGTPPGTHLVADLGSEGGVLLMAGIGQEVLFAAYDASAGFELWHSDGTASGTSLLKDIRPGPDSFLWGPFPDFFSNQTLGYSPRWAAGTQRLFFEANDGGDGQELWGSDGTVAGTNLLADLTPGPGSSELRWLTAVGGRAYFAADDGVAGRELWTSDGTPAGTHLVADLVPGAGSSMPQSIAAVNDEAFFAAWTPASGLELWRSNGTSGGTLQVADINSGPGSSSPSSLTVSPPYLHFVANDGSHGFELWGLLLPQLALAPSELGIDDTLGNANGLWEPAEAVKLQPVWENLATSNITAVTGTAAGTNGAQCSDATAAYGTFAPLDLRSCLSTGNCYAAALNGPRPSLHWDVTLHETLSTGKVYDWPIHIAGSFDDVGAEDAGYADVEAFLHANLTAGCTATSFCPQDVVTRAQAALFLSLGLANGDANLVPFSGAVPGKGAYDCTDNGVSVFTDVNPEDPFCRFIHDLAARGISLGCSADSFCPSNTLTRAQFALLIGKTFAGGAIPVSLSGPGGAYDCSPGTPEIYFTDVDEYHPFCAAAHYLWARGITDGCEASSFCPDGPVARRGAAFLLTRAFAVQLP